MTIPVDSSAPKATSSSSSELVEQEITQGVSPTPRKRAPTKKMRLTKTQMASLRANRQESTTDGNDVGPHRTIDTSTKPSKVKPTNVEKSK